MTHWMLKLPAIVYLTTEETKTKNETNCEHNLCETIAKRTDQNRGATYFEANEK